MEQDISNKRVQKPPQQSIQYLPKSDKKEKKMMNITGGQENTTKMSSPLSDQVIRMTVFIPTFFFYFIFLYFIAVMLRIFFRSPGTMESVRHVFFAHMIINDTVYLTFSLFLSVLYFFPITFPISFCYLIVTVTSTTLKVTPYNLAAMSLERYIAICYPLRHGEFSTVHRCSIAILVMWIIGLIPNMADFMIVILSVEKNYFVLYVKCSRFNLKHNPAQDIIRVFSNAFPFALAGLIIIYTYAKIMMVAVKMNSGKASASKAGKTIMLHAFQLLLCMTSLAHRIVEMHFPDKLILLTNINFCLFMCLPRLISPLIYGIRDELQFLYEKRTFLQFSEQLIFPESLENS
ncbi:odorant receptor 131-2-like [Dendrobates tinctorius]|uniref:odorant receptor 131-2-like n=1 Tax=Dendrobates tinctorius TaxID=92724 RepID=UPI003CC9E80A